MLLRLRTIEDISVVHRRYSHVIIGALGQGITAAWAAFGAYEAGPLQILEYLLEETGRRRLSLSDILDLSRFSPVLIVS